MQTFYIRFPEGQPNGSIGFIITGENIEDALQRLWPEREPYRPEDTEEWHVIPLVREMDSPDAHGFLMELGYSHEYEPSSWHDDGDGESGPRLAGGPAFDMYTAPDHYIILDDYGRAHYEPRDLEMEAWYDEHFAACGDGSR